MNAYLHCYHDYDSQFALAVEQGALPPVTPAKAIQVLKALGAAKEK